MIGMIKGTGSSIPHRKISNDHISQLVETNDQWIRERTGVENRYVVEEETTVSMAIEASKKALIDGGIEAMDLDMILVATASSDVIMPNTACMVQAAVEASKAVCMDLNAACSGFLFAYNTAQAYIHIGMAKHILVIGAESLSKLVDWSDRGTCILFGDGAGAVVLQAQEGTKGAMVMHANGEKGSALICNTIFPNTKFSNKDIGCLEDKSEFIQMNGQEVFRFAVKQVPLAIKEVLDQAELQKEEIDYFILHQANKRIVESVAKKLQVPIERFPMNLQKYGNTSSASIPILLDELNREGKLKNGMKLIMVGFGAGLTWGATYLEWQK